jgi:hypothetical protein
MTLPRIFVSHSSQDDDFGTRLVENLRSALGGETAVWYDSRGGLRGGDDWWPKIVKELTACNVFIVVLSPDAMASPWVNDEINLAWRQKNSPTRMRIIPVLYRPCQVRPDLLNLQIIRFTTYEETFQDLLIALGLSVESVPAPARPDPTRLPTELLVRIAFGAPPRNKWRTAVYLGLALVVLIVGAVGLFATINQNTLSVTRATATAQAQATATALASQNPYPPHIGTLVLNERLNGNSDFQWDEATGSCSFTPGGYHVTDLTQARTPQVCAARNTNFSDLTFEVQMNILQGSGGGILFRSDSSAAYYFRISQDGNYALFTCTAAEISCTQLTGGGAFSWVHQGLNQRNLIAAVVKGNHIELYIGDEHEDIDGVNNNIALHGQIGVVADANSEVEFSDARVWIP